MHCTARTHADTHARAHTCMHGRLCTCADTPTRSHLPSQPPAPAGLLAKFTKLLATAYWTTTDRLVAPGHLRHRHTVRCVTMPRSEGLARHGTTAHAIAAHCIEMQRTAQRSIAPHSIDVHTHLNAPHARTDCMHRTQCMLCITLT